MISYQKIETKYYIIAEIINHLQKIIFFIKIKKISSNGNEK